MIAVRNPQHPLRRHVGTGGIRCQVIAVVSVGAGTGTTADRPVGAAAALAGQAVWVAEFLKNRVVAVDIDQRIAPHVPGNDRQEAAWRDLARVGDEAEPIAGVDRLRCAPEPSIVSAEPGAADFLAAEPLMLDPVKMVSLGELQIRTTPPTRISPNTAATEPSATSRNPFTERSVQPGSNQRDRIMGGPGLPR